MFYIIDYILYNLLREIMATNTFNDDYLQQIADARAKLTQCFNKTHEQLTERETVLLRELDKICEEYETDSKRQAEELKDLQDAKDSILKKIADNETLTAALKLIDSRIAAIFQTADTRKISFLWDDDLKRDIKHLGHIKMNDLPTPHPSRAFTPGVKPLIPDYKSKCQPVITCCKKNSDAKAPGELYSPRGIALDHLTDRIYLADASHHRVQVFSSNGDYCFMFCANMNRPLGICIYNNIIHVSQQDAHGINLYKIDGTYINKIGSKGTGEGQFTNPLGIAVSEKTEYLYVCDYSNHRFCFDKNKDFHSILGIGKFHYPVDVKLTRCTVIILDESDPCVHLFSLDHEPISSVISRGTGKQIARFYFFDIDRETNIIITDASSHTVKIFSKLGVLIHQFGKNGEEAGEFKSPHGILLDNKGRIVVVLQLHKLITVNVTIIDYIIY